VYDKIVADAPTCHCEPAEGWRGNLGPKRGLWRLGTLSTPCLFRDCFVGVRLLAMTSFSILTCHFLVVHQCLVARATLVGGSGESPPALVISTKAEGRAEKSARA